MDTLLRKAANDKDPVKRLAYIAIFRSVALTYTEKGVSKPFNPLLGETYELVRPGKFKYLAEQVCHHPAICSFYIEGDQSAYKMYGTYHPQSKFTKGTLQFRTKQFDYIELPEHSEQY